MKNFNNAIGIFDIFLLVFVTTWARAPAVNAQMPPADSHHMQLLSEPWELVVQMGMKGSVLRFPVKVTDENRSEKLDKVLPLMGTALKIKLLEYLPDLTWQNNAVESEGAGSLVNLVIKGETLEQQLWLRQDDPSRSSITSSVGRISLNRLHNSESISKTVKQLTDPKAIGVLTVKLKGGTLVRDYVIRPGEKIVLGDSRYNLTIM